MDEEIQWKAELTKRDPEIENLIEVEVERTESSDTLPTQEEKAHDATDNEYLVAAHNRAIWSISQRSENPLSIREIWLTKKSKHANRKQFVPTTANKSANQTRQ